MPVTNYYSVNGSIIGEVTGGVRTDYLTDALGSVTATVDSSGNLLNTYRYKPYGEQLAKTGVAADPKFTWVGTLGYRQTGRKHSDTYVRARHYGTAQGRWTTKDPITSSLLYIFCYSNPIIWTDPSGYDPTYTNCTIGTQNAVKKACNCLKTLDAQGWKDVIQLYNSLNYIYSTRPHGAKCPKLTESQIKCMKTACDGSCTKVECVSDTCYNCSNDQDGKPAKTCAYTLDQGKKCGTVYLCYPRHQTPACLNQILFGDEPLVWRSPTENSMYHELLHICGVDHGKGYDGGHPACNELAAHAIISACEEQKARKPKPGIPQKSDIHKNLRHN